MRSLLAQHTAETGQEFATDVMHRIWHCISGQPQLVNALGLHACFEDEQGWKRSQPMRLDAIDRPEATVSVIRVTYLDQLASQLTVVAVRSLVLPIIAGSVYACHSTRPLE